MPKILGIKFDPVTEKEAIDQISKWLNQDKQRHIVTPNPEIVLAAQKNPKFRQILNNSDLSIADGTGIIWAAKRQKTPLPARVTGTDLMQKLCQQSKAPIFLLGAASGIAKIVAKKYQQSNIVGTESGSPRQEEEKQIIEKINKSGAKLLFVAFGAPTQEIWIHKNLAKMPNIKVAIGIGGAFDFLSGKIKRAPKWMRKLGLEWLYRLIKQPTRIKRIYNAVIKFPFAIITS